MFAVSEVLNNQAANMIGHQQVANTMTKAAVPAQSLVGPMPKDRTFLSGTKVGKIAAQGGKAISFAGKEVGTTIKDSLPTAGSTTTSAIKKRFIGGVVVGGLANMTKGVIKVANGDYTTEQAIPYIMKDTMIGAVSGAAFVGGMFLTDKAISATLGKAFLASNPIVSSIAGIVVGTVGTYGLNQGIKAALPGWDI